MSVGSFIANASEGSRENYTTYIFFLYSYMKSHVRFASYEDVNSVMKKKMLLTNIVFAREKGVWSEKNH